MRYGLPEERWKKSSYSDSAQNSCVEMQRTDDGLVAIGDSTDRSQGAFVFSPEAVASFVAAVKSGEFSTLL